jgi:DNA-binding PadR family transcriptional regulator
MEEKGWLRASWGESETRRKAKFYELTKTGRRQLETEKERWKTISVAVTRALET